MATKRFKNIGILGYGEIGSAIASLYKKGDGHQVSIQDPGLSRFFHDDLVLDVLHVCIPWSKTFVSSVLDIINKHGRDAVVIIHSTVEVGTTELIGQSYKFVVHSPCRGVHPNLAKGLRTFVKYIGADTAGVGELAAKHFADIGIKGEVVRKSRTTELMKLLDTTYYGLAIAFHAYANQLCDGYGVSFERVMTEANMTYNEGYTKLKKKNVVRPVLVSPENGKIGGHCVIPNAKILEHQNGKDPILQAILRHESPF